MQRHGSPTFSLRLSLAWLCVFMSTPVDAVGQVVVGTVREQGTGEPVLGAMVRLMADSSWTGVRFLTAADGRFSLKAARPGFYGITVERIGFASTAAGAVTLTEGQTLTHDIEVTASPVRLQGLEVAGSRRRCRLTDDPGGRTQSVWDEVRKALDAARWTEREAGLQFQLVTHIRTLDSSGRRVLDEKRRTSTASGGNSVRTLPPADLVKAGYVQKEEDGATSWYGPDAAVLLSDEFLGTHCFTLVDGPADQPDLLGLEFTPVQGRDVPDIRGVMWVDRNSARLDRVEFRYVGLDQAAGDDQARGEVRFAELSDGRWIVRDWSIRAPLLALSRRTVSGRPIERVMVTGVQEQGSDVVRARGRDVEWLADIAVGGVAGTVWDSVAGRGLSGAEVALPGRAHVARTDTSGAFTMEGVAPGTYRITFDAPSLDSLGVEPAAQEVVVQAGREARVDLAVPSLMSILALGCPTPRAVVGRVRGDDGEPLEGVVVTAVGVAPDASSPAATGSAVTRADGGYRICLGGAAATVAGATLAAAPDTAHVSARFGPLSSGTLAVAVPSGGYGRADLTVGTSASAVSASDASGDSRPGLVATVVDEATREPLEGVAVRLVAEDGGIAAAVLSDPRGRVLLFPPSAGRYTVHAERLGFAPSESQPLDLSRGTRRVEIRLATRAIPLEEMVVSVRGTVLSLARNGFYERQVQTTGRFVVREDFERMPTARTSDLITRVPGVGPVTFNEESAETTKHRIQFSRAHMSVDRRCLPVIYVDGAMVREGGIFTPDSPSRWPTVDELVGPMDIEGIELYNTRLSAPARFQGPGAECGVVVIWLRRGGGG